MPYLQHVGSATSKTYKIDDLAGTISTMHLNIKSLAVTRVVISCSNEYGWESMISGILPDPPRHSKKNPWSVAN